VQKTIRFELKPSIISRKYNNVKGEKNNADIESFVKDYQKVIYNVEKIIFQVRNYSNEKRLNSKIKIKFSWLKTYTKQNYYAIKDSIVKINKW